ncbi:hypothetical protein YH65_03290 [Sulfurovum lithotrophicum]|uniref:Uncharacterized protein n=1 Tax=Sulfurovum lithotrophicum TaxID=206403 RepID=A0A7U4M0B6_9BACT|nr:hypothetical protein [Sulfurovum lithotrophicum]AKF24520.1 hypothetical protein YH65_03290 [Sulfurovum lithotrophicum]
MSKNDNVFDISMLLMTLFSSLEVIRNEKNIELVYDVDLTVPKELKGNSDVLLHLLTQVLTFVLQNTENKEVVLSISAPEDFLYEELVTFAVKESGINEMKIDTFIENRLTESLEVLSAEIDKNETKGEDIVIKMPLKVDDIGNQRHYRLPDISMLGKKVLLICAKKRVAASIEKMFRYFLYEVDVGLEAYKKQGSNLSRYDIVAIEAALATEKLEELIERVQKKHSLKYVIIENANFNMAKANHPKVQTAYLIKPVMQESIFELIIELFKDDVLDRTIRSDSIETIIDMKKYINYDRLLEAEKYVLQAKKEHERKKVTEQVADTPSLPVLDTEVGLKNAKTVGMDYKQKLRNFLDDFKRSDIFFRDNVKDKLIWKTKEFLIDVEKEARFIGALRLTAVIEQASMLFVYDKLEDLPLYVNKYHLELVRLVKEINKYLKG